MTCDLRKERKANFTEFPYTPWITDPAPTEKYTFNDTQFDD